MTIKVCANSKIKFSKRDVKKLEEIISGFMIPDLPDIFLYSDLSNSLNGQSFGKKIKINQNWVETLLNQEIDQTVTNAFLSTIGHEEGHCFVGDYWSKNPIIILSIIFTGLNKKAGNILKKAKFILNTWEVHADFYSCFNRLSGNRDYFSKSIDFKINFKVFHNNSDFFMEFDKEEAKHPSWSRRKEYILNYNFDRVLLRKIADDVGMKHDEKLFNEILDKYGEIILDDKPPTSN